MTTPARNAQTAALEALIEAHAIELKLPTVRRRYRALAQEATREQQTPVAYGLRLRDSSSPHHHHRIRQDQPSTTTRREVGPLQAIAPGPVQAVVFRRGSLGLHRHHRVRS
jgi:hypothetical protein